MFAWWGRTVYQFRYIVIGVMVALCLGGGIYGADLGKHVTQSGFYDEGSQSVKASVLGDQTYGRDRTSHVVATFTAPDGQTVDDPAWRDKVVAELNKFKSDHPDQVVGWAGWLAAPDSTNPTPSAITSAVKLNKNVRQKIVARRGHVQRRRDLRHTNAQNLAAGAGRSGANAHQ